MNLFQSFDKYNISNFKINLITELDPNKSKDYAKSQLFDFIKSNDYTNNSININT